VADIRKKLIISGEIDAKFKRELQSFAKEVSKSFSVGFDAKGLKDAASSISKAAKELRDAANALKGVNAGNIGGGRAGGVGHSGGGRARGPAGLGGGAAGGESLVKRQQVEDQTKFDLERLKEKEQKTKEIAKKEQEQFKERLIWEKALERQEAQKRKSTDRSVKEEFRQQEVLHREKTKKAREAAKEEKRIFDQKSDEWKDLFGMVGINQRVGGRLGDIMANKSPTLAGKFAKVGVGGLLGVGAAAEGFSSVRDLQVMAAKRRQAFGAEALSEGTTSAMIGESGRQSLMAGSAGAASGALKYGAMGAVGGSLIGGPIGTLAGGLIGAAFGGYKGWMEGGAEEAARRKEETALGMQATNLARAHRGNRLDYLRGGGNKNAITGIEFGGTQQGFTAQESIQQFLAARQSLGNKGATEGLAGMQKLYNLTGMGVGEQAQAAEQMIGGSSSRTAQIGESMKKWFAAGLDQSKLAQGIQATANYVAQSAGLGRVNAGGIEENILKFAAASAGGGPMTQADIQRGAGLQQMLKSESTAKGGIAGIGNLLQVQTAMGPDASTEQVMAALNMSSEASLEDMQKVLGPEMGKKLFESRKQGTQATGFGGLNLNDLTSQVAFGSPERGITGEQQLGALQMQQGGKVGSKELQDTISQTTEFKSAIHDAKINAAALDSGFRSLTTEVDNSRKALRQFIGSLEDSMDYIKKYTGEYTVQSR
jgi:hypothetical protein